MDIMEAKVGDRVSVKGANPALEGVILEIEYARQYGPDVKISTEGGVRYYKSFHLEILPRKLSVEEHKAEMLDSYMLAIAECGGSPSKFIKDINTMTVKEMVDILAQNGVRFTTKSGRG